VARLVERSRPESCSGRIFRNLWTRVSGALVEETDRRHRRGSTVFTLVVEAIVGAIWPTSASTSRTGRYALEMPLRDFGGTTQLLPWWGGACMLLIYGIALGVLGTFTTLRSDVT